MFEDIISIFMGFGVTYLGLEVAWHFTACKINNKMIKPCLFKQLGFVE